MPLLLIKLGIMKQFVKPLDKTLSLVLLTEQRISGFEYKKLKASMFDGPRINLLIKDNNFEHSMIFFFRIGGLDINCQCWEKLFRES